MTTVVAIFEDKYQTLQVHYTVNHVNDTIEKALENEIESLSWLFEGALFRYLPDKPMYSAGTFCAAFCAAISLKLRPFFVSDTKRVTVDGAYRGPEGFPQAVEWEDMLCVLVTDQLSGSMDGEIEALFFRPEMDDKTAEWSVLKWVQILPYFRTILQPKSVVADLWKKHDLLVDPSEDVVCLTLSREDIIQTGYNPSKLSRDNLQDIANKLADSLVDENYWDSLTDICGDFDMPDLPDCYHCEGTGCERDEEDGSLPHIDCPECGGSGKMERIAPAKTKTFAEQTEDMGDKS